MKTPPKDSDKKPGKDSKLPKFECPLAGCNWKGDSKKFRAHVNREHNLRPQWYHLDLHGVVILQYANDIEAIIYQQYSPETIERLKAHAKSTNRQLCELCLYQKEPMVTFFKNSPDA